MLSRLAGFCWTVLFWICLTVPAVAAEAAEIAEGQKKSWWDLFKTTGPVGVLLVILSMIGTSLLIQYYVRYREKNLGNPEFLQHVEALLNRGEADEAFELAHSDNTYA